jgi:hypothetical protein
MLVKTSWLTQAGWAPSAPTGDFNQFIQDLDISLKHLFKLKREFVICGDINTDFLVESNNKNQLTSLLTTYNMSHTVNFATRIQNHSYTAIDNTFIDNSRMKLTSTSPINKRSIRP